MRSHTGVWLLLLSGLLTTLAQNDGWNFTPLAGATDRDNANLLALSASFENGTDPRLPVWWSTFKGTFYKTYASKEAEDKAYKNFLHNLDVIYSTNSDINIPYWLSGNFYADYDYETFKETFLMTQVNLTLLNGGRRLLTEDQPITHHELQARRRLQGTTVDWRTTGRLTPVENQGGCGSCWAYAATTAIEAAYLISQRQTSAFTKLNLAEQQLIDCSGAGTCNGGGSGGAIDYVANRFQVVQSIYPSTYRDGSCQQNGGAPFNQAVRLSRTTIYPGNSEAALMRAVAQQPIVIYFQVVGDFFSYAGGIYRPTSCGTAVNHAMVAVGYVYTGSPSSSYWIIRNSWGGGWGENGYVRVQMTGTSTGPCGMYMFQFQVPTQFSLTINYGSQASPPPAPRAPRTPSAPGTPDAPDTPDNPSAPDTPPEPYYPDQPGSPDYPTAPEAPPAPPPPRQFRHRPPRPPPPSSPSPPSPRSPRAPRMPRPPRPPPPPPRRRPPPPPPRRRPPPPPPRRRPPPPRRRSPPPRRTG